MFIALYYIITNMAMPKLTTITTGLASTIAVIIITIIGLRILLSLFNVNPSGNTTGLIVKAIVDAISYTCKKAVEAAGWIIRKMVEVTPKIYTQSKKFFNQRGLSNTVSTLLSGVVVILFIAIVI